jgi:hypothetical protein
MGGKEAGYRGRKLLVWKVNDVIERNPWQRIEGKGKITAWGIGVWVAGKAHRKFLLVVLEAWDVRGKDLLGIGSKGSLIRHAPWQFFEGFQRMKLRLLIVHMGSIHGNEDSLRSGQFLTSQDNFMRIKLTALAKSFEVETIPMAPCRQDCFQFFRWP